MAAEERVPVHNLIGQHFRMLEVEPFCLSLTFSVGDLVRIFSDDGLYECGLRPQR